MARRGLEVVGLALAVVAATLCAPCSAQTPPTTSLAMPNCPPAPISLSPCIGYVFGVGSATLSSCCSQLQAFVQSQGPCLCAVSKLAPSPLGLFLGQAQAMIPNVCNLPTNPCDDLASTPPVASTTPPATPLAPTAPVPSAATTAAATTPSGTPAAPATTPSTTPADPEASEAPPVPADDSPAAVTAPGEATPAGAESNTGSEVGSKIPELLHSAGARSARYTNAGSALITLFLAYALAMRA